ncbi:MAG TPA: bifunctional glutamate N-acetyltransferase/amino-acid acetyltransferase ArgJ [Gammaproteobacteria bacterium]|nr:bifunctional glutamate N-acetyltransferase/amino-acid acetyltransferase ArgJ [Gammaproteobacteria bacterium]
MTRQKPNLPELFPVRGFRLGTAAAGIKRPDRTDLVVMALAEGSLCTAVFTRNAFCAAPVTVAREFLAQGQPSYLLINTGNANAGTGEPGIRAARQCCESLAQHAGCEASAVLPFSTGVIGEPLPVDRICAALPDALARLDENGWAAAASGILTTDTVPKGISRQVDIGGESVTITGIAKGSGMIRPDMATMLAFIATDAHIEADALRQCLAAAVEQSFNRITVDGDTSTNDACVLVATTAGSASVLHTGDDDYDAFCDALNAVCIELAQAIVRDGEGATRFVTVSVEGGADSAECLQVAYTIAHSPLVKTALFAGDPNWGRILAAVGRAGLQSLDLEAVEIYLDEICIVRAGARAGEYTESAGQQVMNRDELTIRVVLGRGGSCETIWTCDLSYDYVRINAEYRT